MAGMEMAVDPAKLGQSRGIGTQDMVVIIQSENPVASVAQKVDACVRIAFFRLPNHKGEVGGKTFVKKDDFHLD